MVRRMTTQQLEKEIARLDRAANRPILSIWWFYGSLIAFFAIWFVDGALYLSTITR